jgi:hypothetical protein
MEYTYATTRLDVARGIAARLATLIDDEGLSARVGADHVGHAKVSMTQDRYVRGRVHTEVADLRVECAYRSSSLTLTVTRP